MRFKPGQSGCPTGRPVGVGAHALTRRRLKDALPEVAEKLIAAALAGDPIALRLYLDRVLPALKPQTDLVEFALPQGSPTDIARRLLELAATGEMAPDVASQLIEAVAKMVAVEQVDELRAQVATLLAERFGDIA